MSVLINSKKLLIANPAAGRGKGNKYCQRVKDYLANNGFETELTFSGKANDLTTQVKKACADNYTTIIVLGGDGSVYEAVNGIMQAKEMNNDINPALGIIPLGTGNDFIKATKIPSNWREACDFLLNANPQSIDVAKIITKNKSAYFINNIGSGFDAGIGITASKMPFLKGKIVYVLGLLWHLIKGVPNPNIEYTIDDQTHNSKMTIAAVSNGTTYGGSFKIAPQASIKDGLLDVIIAPPLGRLTALPLIIRLLFGTHLKRKDILHKQCKSFNLKSDLPIPVVADGEIIDEGCMEYSVELLENGINLLT